MLFPMHQVVLPSDCITNKQIGMKENIGFLKEFFVHDYLEHRIESHQTL
jgi:hypothetical protein